MFVFVASFFSYRGENSHLEYTLLIAELISPAFKTFSTPVFICMAV